MERRREIVKLREAGLTYTEIGRRWGISNERVRQIVKGSPVTHKPELDSKVMLSVSDVAKLLGICVNTVRRWSQRGILKAYCIGPRRDRRFRRSDIDDFLGGEHA